MNAEQRTAVFLAELGELPAMGSRRGRSLRRRTEYGKRGGQGPTAGETAAVYDFTFPDNTYGKKRSFKFHGVCAVAFVYQNNGRWYAAGIGDGTEPNMQHYRKVLATKIA
jgi:hypothetical protein